MVMAGKFLPSILISARSVVLSVPMIRAEYSLLSFNVTVSSSASATTWLLVTMYPSAEIITPEPEPCCFGVRTLRFCLPPLPWGLPKKPNGSPKKSENGSLSTSTVCTFEFLVLRICTTEGSDFSAAYVRSTGCAGTADVVAGVAFTLSIVPVEKASESALIATTTYFEYFFIMCIF